MSNITFGTRDLHTGAYHVTAIAEHFAALPREMIAAQLARRPGGKLLAVREPMGTITIEGYVTGTSIANLNSNIDALQIDLGLEAQNLTYHIDGDTRRIVATRQSLVGDFNANYNAGLFWEYTALFVAAQPFAEAASASTDSRSLALSSIGGGQFRNTYALTVGGSGPTYPTFTITVPAATAYAITELWVGNESDSPLRQIKLIQNLVASDVVEIDCDLYTVKVNGTIAAVTRGQFPTLDRRLGATNTIRITATAGSAPTLNPVATSWKPRFYN